MRRDLDLIRAILLNLEAYPHLGTGVYLLNGGDSLEFAYNMRLMSQHGLIACNEFIPLSGTPIFSNVSLTWSGNDFLDAVRDEEIWKKTKEGVGKVGGFTFDLLKRLAVGLVETQLEKYTGVKLGN